MERGSQSYVLRELRSQDYDAVMALWNSAPGVRANESSAEFASILTRNPGLGSAAEAEGVLVAAVLACHDGRRGYLYHLAVAPSHRGQGIGRALVERCLQRLQADGIARCSIHLVADNDDGAAFWRQTGWRERTDLKVMCRDL